MKKIKFISLIILSAVLLSSCKNSGGGMLSSSSAAPNEVLVVMNDVEWNAPQGRALYDILNSQVQGILQPEANFRILHVAPANFTKAFQMARTIILTDVSNKYSKGSMSVVKNRYAKDQLVITFKAGTNEMLEEYLIENSADITAYLIKSELTRIARWLKKSSGSPKTLLKNKFGISIDFLKGLSNIEEKENFFWATNNGSPIRQDIVIYSFPYTDSNVFSRDSLVAIRDRVLGEHIKGSFNSQMAVEPKVPVIYRTLSVDDKFRAEMRGLWIMTTDMMGGPFVSQAFVNENTNMVIVVDVFVYSPQKRKRNALRNMEASFYTISFEDKE